MLGCAMAAASASRAKVHSLRRNPRKSRALARPLPSPTPLPASLRCPNGALTPVPKPVSNQALDRRPGAQTCPRLVDKTHREDAVSSAEGAVLGYLRRRLGALKWTEKNVWAWRMPPGVGVAASPADLRGPVGQTGNGAVSQIAGTCWKGGEVLGSGKREIPLTPLESLKQGLFTPDPQGQCRCSLPGVARNLL